MPDWRVPLADVQISEQEIDAVAETYRSGWLSMGPRTQELEEKFAGYVGTKHAVAVSNGTAALHLAAVAAGLGPGDEVVVPSLTFVATVTTIRQAGAAPVFADIAGLDRPWISAETAEAAIGDRTKAIVNMTYGGHPSGSSELAALASGREVILLEDAAHGLGGSQDGRPLGTFGLAGAFSFFSNKNLPVGEGGMLVTDDDDLAARARLLRSHGMTTLTWDRHKGHAGGYDVIEPGFNYRIDEPRATLAIARLARLDADNERRAAAAGLYRERLAGRDDLTLVEQPPEGDMQANHLFTAVVAEGIDRDAVRERLSAEGVQSSVHYPPVHRFSAYDSDAELPLTEAYASRALTLPLFPNLTEEAIELVVRTLGEALDRG